MANIKITDLDAYTNPDSTDVLPIVDVGADETKKVSIADLMENAGGGTEGLPGIAFGSDPDTGIYRPAADQLAFSTGGTQRILIDDSGVVTIAGDLTVNGTTTTVNSTTVTVDDKNIELGSVGTPTDTTADGGGITLKGATDKTLNWVNSTDSWTSSENVDLASGKTYKINGTDVLSATALGSAVQISSDNIPSGTIVNDDVNASAAIAGTKISADFGAQDLTVDTDVLHVDATNDRVGVGTSSPTHTLEVAGKIAVVGTESALGNSSIPSIYRSGSDSGSYPFDAFGHLVVQPRCDGANRDIVFATGTSGANKIVIDSSGRLGVGTTSPSSPLHISSSEDRLLLLQSSDANAYIAFQDSDSSGDTVNRIGTVSDGIYFNTGGGGERLRIDSSGRVGIGTSSPTQKLHVEAGYLLLNSSQSNGSGDARLLINQGSRQYTLYPWSGDSNSTVDLRLSTPGASNQVTITDAGNVGIGTTSPGHSLTVRAGTANSDIANFTGATVGRGLVIGTSNDGGTGDDTIIYNATQSTGGHVFEVNASEKVRIDSSGRLLIGHSSSVRGGALEVLGETANTQIQVTESSDSGDGPQLALTRTRGSDLGSPSPVEDGNSLGRIRWRSWDSAAYRIGAEISALADGQTWASSDCPTRLVFSTTADGASAPTTRMQIKPDGKVGIGGIPDSSALLGVQAGSTEELSDSSGLYNQSNPAFVHIKNNTDDISDPECGIILHPRNSSNGAVALYAKRTGSFTSDLIYRVRTGSATSQENIRFLHGGGIAFNGDTAAANALDDYEEGTWTPTLDPASGSFTSVTYQVQNGTYTKIGNTVFLRANFYTNGITVGTASGNLRVSGLPFVDHNISGMALNDVRIWDKNPSSCGTISGNLVALFKRGSYDGDETPMQVTDLVTSGVGNLCQFSGVYDIT